MRNRIYFYANFGDFSKPPYGGGEAGNRKTLELFNHLDYDIVLIPKFQHVDGVGIINKVLRVWYAIWGMIKYFFVLLFGRRENSIVHVVGYYVRKISYETILVKIAKGLGYRVVYEMRAGGAIEKYHSFGSSYCNKFDYIINHADKIFSQGLENIPLLESIKSDVDVYYYPNYVMSDFYPKEYPQKPDNHINFMYFGRLSEPKNIELIIETFEHLATKVEKSTLTIVGNYISDEYKSRIETKVQKSLFSEQIYLKPACNRSELKEYLKDKHIYIFPTQESGEGHSNALTEAMAWGLIPIVSQQGFNEGIVGRKELVVEELTPNSISDRVMSIIENDKLQEMSKYVYNRVQELYTDKQALVRMKDVYSNMFDKYNNK